MYQKLNIRPLGLIENMSHFECPNCGHESDIFGRGAGEGLAHALEIPFLGRLPIYEPIRIGGDGGHPIVLAEPDSAAARAFRSVAEQAAAQISIASYSRVIPLTPVR
jgi:ATP-binding protein involved in chromosome partitioning